MVGLIVWWVSLVSLIVGLTMGYSYQAEWVRLAGVMVGLIVGQSYQAGLLDLLA